MSRPITPATSLDNLKQEAKRWLRALRAGDAEAGARLQRAVPDAPASPVPPTLRDVQHALAREHGVPGWATLKRRLENTTLRRYEEVAEALVTAYRTPDPVAMKAVWSYFGHMRAWEGMRRYIRLDLGGPEEPDNPDEDFITLAQARHLVARAQQFESWDALVAFAGMVPPGAEVLPKAAGAYVAGDREPLESSETVLARSWNDLLGAMRERGLTALHASGQMTDAVLQRVAQLEQIEELDLSGSDGITDLGLRHLARLPRLRHLNLAGCPVGDEGAAVIGRLPNLEQLSLASTRVTDDGAAHLADCHALKAVDLSGTRTGDGAIAALAGRPALHDFRSGQEVTNAGLTHLRDFPVFRTWQGDQARLELLGFDGHPNRLRLRGRFGNAGLAHLAVLEGLFALDLDSDRLAVTGAGLAPLAALPHFAWLSFDAKDESMSYIAALPHLRFLVCQDTTAGDDGFVALSRTRTLEYLWGRECHNLGTRGFLALSEVPSLRSLSVSCRSVSEEGLAALPRFPALRELMPMGVPDEGYRHVGRCHAIESLVLMYCRETTDRATGYIAELPALRKYFASYTRITDRTPELLSEMSTLEDVTFDSCAGLTNAGISALARLPGLRRLRVGGMRSVTREVAAAFGGGAKVSFTP